MRTYISVSRRWKKNDGYVEQAGSRRKEEGDWGRKERREKQEGFERETERGSDLEEKPGISKQIANLTHEPSVLSLLPLQFHLSPSLFLGYRVSRFPLLSFFLLRHFQKGNRIHVRTPVKRNALPVLRINRLSNNFPLSSFLTIVTTYHSGLI